MKVRSLVALAASAVLLAAAVQAEEKISLEGVKCPVSGRPAKEEHTVEYKDAKVFFCCPNCVKAFNANTEKFAAKANHQLAATGQAKEVKCPLTGRPLNQAQVVEVSGVKVAFCCGNCKAKVAKAEGEEQLILVFSDKAFEKGYQVGEAKEEK